MNAKFMTSIAMLALLAVVTNVVFANSAYAAEYATKDTTKPKTTPPTTTKPKTTPPTTKPKATPPVPTPKPSTNGAPTASIVEISKGSSDSKGGCDASKNCYSPSMLSVSQGTTVTWKNVDSAAHTVTASDQSFDSGLINAGSSFDHLFTTAGTYDYMCIVHPWMKGTVVVN